MAPGKAAVEDPSLAGAVDALLLHVEGQLHGPVLAGLYDRLRRAREMERPGLRPLLIEAAGYVPRECRDLRARIRQRLSRKD